MHGVSMLEVRLLGTFELREEGRALDVPSRPAQSLFAYLILNAGSTHRRERLAGLLWPASTEETARNNLRQALWRLRKALPAPAEGGPEFLLADSFTIGFHPQARCWLDVSVIEETPGPTWSADRLIQAVEVYRGELLPGFYEDWVVLERERLRGLADSRLHLLLDRLQEEERWPEAVKWAEHWVAGGEVPEPAYRALMLAHHRLGDVAAATAAYQRCVQALQAELSVEPSEQTSDLYAQISSGTLALGGAPAGAAPASLSPPPAPAFLASLEPAPPAATVFVGRERALAQLMGFLRHAISGRGLTVMVTGEPGIGKTALLRRLAVQAQADFPGLIVASGSGNALTGIGDPYLPFRDILGVLTADVEAKWAGGAITSGEARRLWDLLPLTVQALLADGPDLIGSFLPGPSLLQRVRAHAQAAEPWVTALQRLVERNALRRGEAPFQQKDLFNQVTKVLQSLAHHHPLLLLLDDLQWSDAESLGLLFHLTRRIGDHPILVVCASRPMEWWDEAQPVPRLLEEILAELRLSHSESVIDLGQRDADEGQAFIDAFLDTEPNTLNLPFRQELRRHTGGHPFFTIELLRAMQARGDLLRDAAGRWIAGPQLNWEQLPGRVEGVIEERLQALGDDLLDVLQVAAVVGEECIAEVIAHVQASDVREVVHLLSDKLDRQFRLVTALGSRRLGGARLSIYRFRHILFQKHLYNRLDVVQRAYMHESVGDALESIYAGLTGEIAVLLAHHFAESGRVRKAVTYLQQAAEQARRLSAHAEAVGHLRRALGLLETLPEGSERRRLELGLQTSLGVSLIATRGYGAAEVEQAFGRGRELCRGMPESPPLFPALYGLRTFHMVRGEHQAAVELGQQLLTIAEAVNDPELLVEAHQALGTTSFYRGELAAAKEHLERGLALYDLDRDQGHAVRFGQDPAVACHSYLAWTLWLAGQSTQAARRTTLALDLAGRVAHPFSMALALIFAGLLARHRGDLTAALAHATSARSLSSEKGFPFWLAMATMVQGMVRVDSGDRQGIAHIEQGLADWQQLGSRLGRPIFQALLAEAQLKWGQVDQAEVVLDTALAEVEQSGERLNLAELYRLRAAAHAARAQDEQAGHWLQQAVDIAGSQGAVPYALRAALDLWRLRGGRSDVEQTIVAMLERLPADTDLAEAQEARRVLQRSQ